MKRILLISQYFPPDITAASFRIGELARYLSNSGRFNVEVLTTTPHKSISENRQDFIEEKKVHRIKIRSKKHGIQYIEFLRGARKLVKSLGNFDWVFVSSPPISVYEVAKPFLKKAKIFLDVRDLWPDTPIAAGKLKMGLKYRFFKNYEYCMYKAADFISVVSVPMAKYIKGIISDESRVIVVYNGVSKKDLEDFPLKLNEKSDIGIFNIFYTGNLGLLQGLEIIPKAISLISNLPIRFTFIGSGVLEKYLKSQLSDYKEKVAFLPSMPRQALLKYTIENADMLFLNLKKHKILEKTIPSKIFDYLMMSKPIISGIKGEGKEILESTGGCVSFEQDSPESLAEAIKLAIQNYDNLSKNALKNMRKVAATYTREESFEKVARVFEEDGD